MTETFGNVTTEAMASGLAVVAFDYAAAARLIRTDVNGALVPFGDAGAFVETAVRVAADLRRCRALGAEARQTALALDWSGVVAQFEQVLASVMPPASTSPAHASDAAFDHRAHSDSTLAGVMPAPRVPPRRARSSSCAIRPASASVTARPRPVISTTSGTSSATSAV